MGGVLGGGGDVGAGGELNCRGGGSEIIDIARRGAKWPVASGTAAASAGDSDEECKAVARRKKVARRVGQTAAGGRGAEEVAVGPMDPQHR